MSVRFTHEFVCDECGTLFEIAIDDYRGQFDHPPSVPICPDCMDRHEAHGLKCRCGDCLADKGDWLYEQRKDKESMA